MPQYLGAVSIRFGLTTLMRLLLVRRNVVVVVWLLWGGLSYNGPTHTTAEALSSSSSSSSPTTSPVVSSTTRLPPLPSLQTLPLPPTNNRPAQLTSSSKSSSSSSLGLYTLRLERILHPSVTSTAIAYQQCLRAWRTENLGLWMFPPATLVDPGDPLTGLGLTTARTPPAGLREGIVGVSSSTTDNNAQVLEYRVLNPSYFTWPVEHHVGRMWLVPNVVDHDNNNKNNSQIRLIWTVEWIPLWLPPGGATLVQWITQFIITTAIDFVAASEHNPAERELHDDTPEPETITQQRPPPNLDEL